MKIDYDLVRTILHKLEERHLSEEGDPLAVEGYDDDTVTYHVRYLNQGRLVEAVDLSSHSGIDWRPLQMTYAGHEFLQAMRSDTVWQKAKERVLAATGTLSLDALKVVVGKILTDLVG